MADTTRYDRLRWLGGADATDSTEPTSWLRRTHWEMSMRTDVLAELKALRLHGMAQAWGELQAQGNHHGLQTEGWLIEHLLRAEHAERHMRSIAHQMKSARFPLHRIWPDLTSRARWWIVHWSSNCPTCHSPRQHTTWCSSVDQARVKLIWPLPWCGGRHPTKQTCSAVYSTVDLVNALEQEKAQGKAGRIVAALLNVDLVVLDELGYLPFSQAGGALLFHLLSKLYGTHQCADHDQPGVCRMVQCVGDAKMTTALLTG